jgi:rhodanese-related sulfurtransferase
MDTATMNPRTLHSLLGSAGAPLVLDVRRKPAFEADSRLIPGALRPEGDLVAFAAKHGGARPVVTYCVHGHEVSRDAAIALSRAGRDAVLLEGGIEAWLGEGLPTVRSRPEWGVPGGSRWITRERPKIDRIACPWLISRFIDPLAVFDYVPAARVFEEAAARKAVAYDIAGAPVTHRGERCSFDALLEDFELADPALARLADIVRGADTDRLDLAPQSAGLLATSLGLSQRFADDHEMLEHAMPVYDGLYAWWPRRGRWKQRAPQLESAGLSAPPSPTFREALRFWLKLGFISFGGPAGQIAIMHRELVERFRWISERRFLHALNYCMLLPGPEAQQLATYIGWLLHGVRWRHRGGCALRAAVGLHPGRAVVDLHALRHRARRGGGALRREARGRGDRARRGVAHRQPHAAPSAPVGGRGRGIRGALRDLAAVSARDPRRRARGCRRRAARAESIHGALA